MDWYSRKVLSWRISNSMDASFCVDCLEEALRQHGRPEIFNSDQGSQFTSNAFIDVLEQAGVAISMDGRGRCLDNIFVERLWRNVRVRGRLPERLRQHAGTDVRADAVLRLLQRGTSPPVRGLQTPNVVYSTSAGGGAMIVDRFSRKEKAETGQRRSAASERAHYSLNSIFLYGGKVRHHTGQAYGKYNQHLPQQALDHQTRYGP